MSGSRVKISGLKQAEKTLTRLGQGCATFDGMRIAIGNNQPYAWGIVFGRRRNGQLARKAGGTFSIVKAFDAVKGELTRELKKALPGGAEKVWGTAMGLALKILRLTQGFEAFRTGTLRRAWHIEAKRGRG